MSVITDAKLQYSVFKPSNLQLERSSQKLNYTPAPCPSPSPFVTRLHPTPSLLFFVKFPDGQMERTREEEEAGEEGETECR